MRDQRSLKRSVLWQLSSVELDFLYLRYINTTEPSVALTLEPLDQWYYSSLTEWGYAEVDYSATNLGDKNISSLKVKFEAKTADGSIYTASDYFYDLGTGETVSSQAYINVADKECISV